MLRAKPTFAGVTTHVAEVLHARTTFAGVTTHVVEVLHRRPIASVVTTHVLEVLVTRAPCVFLPDYEDPCAIETPLYVVTLRTGDDVVRTAQIPLSDPASYLGGYKEPRLGTIAAIQRNASEWLEGSYPGQSVTVTFADDDHRLRKLLVVDES